MTKLYASQEKFRNLIIKGTAKLSEYVGATLGPAGQNVAISLKNKDPFISKDGATISKNFILSDPFENIAAQIIKQASIQTEKMAGDGTTTTVVLAEAILKNAQRYITSGCNVFEIKKGIEKAVDYIVEKLKTVSTLIKSKEQISQIATISANGDKVIGDIISNAIDSIGRDGSVVIEDSNSYQTVLQIVEGFRFPSGFISQAFLDEGKTFIKYEKPLILVTTNKIEFVEDILPVLKLVARDNRSLVIVADYIEGQALAAIIANVARGTMKVAAINAPFFGEEKKNYLKDLAIVTGASLVSPENNLKLSDVKLEHFGNANFIEIQKAYSIIMDGAGKQENINNRIALIKSEIEQTEDLAMCERLQERITRLSSAVAIIKIGGATEAEVIEKRFRIDDALLAVKSSQEEGVSIGGGLALIETIEDYDSLVNVENEDQQFGLNVVFKAVYEPFNKIIFNSGKNSEVILTKLLEQRKENKNLIYDAKDHKIVDAYQSGIVDPTKVIRCALQNAASAAIVLLTSNFAICDE